MLGTKNSFHHFVVPLPREGGSGITDFVGEKASKPLELLVEWVFVGDWQISLPLEGGGPLAVEGVLFPHNTNIPSNNNLSNS